MHSEAFTQSMGAACREPGVSVAGVALANGLNANQVHRWMRERGIEPPSRRMSGSAELTALADPGFVAVQVAPAVEALVIARRQLPWRVASRKDVTQLCASSCAKGLIR